MKKKYSFAAFVLSLVCSFSAVADCSNQGRLNEGIFNETAQPLVASVFMSWQVFSVNEQSSNLGSDNKFVTKSVDGVTYSNNGSGNAGNVRIQSCAGGGGADYINPKYSRAYDLGVSVGPYVFIPHQGSLPKWETGLDNYYNYYLLDTIKWSGRDIYWNIYTQGKKNFTVKQVIWKERSKCKTEYKNYSICWAVDLETCTSGSGGSCNTWADYYINNLGTSNGPLPGPLGKN